MTLLQHDLEAPFDNAFENSCTVSRYDLTLKDGGDASNADDYGQRPYTVELIDDAMFLDGDYDTELGSDDASLVSCEVYANFYDLVPNLVKGTYEESRHTDLSTYPDIQVWGQFGTDEWVSIATLKPTTSNVYSDGVPFSKYAPEGSSDTTISLPEGCTAVKATCTSTFARVNIRLDVLPKLLPSERVKGDVAGKTSTVLRDWNTLRVLDADGNDAATTDYLSGDSGRARLAERDKELYGAGLFHATDTGSLNSLKASSWMTKTLNGYLNDTANRRIVLSYESTAEETVSYASGSGLTGDKLVDMGVLTPQRSGTFYDLLPMGVEPDMTSVKVTNYGGSVTCSIDSVETVENYRDTGRTLLVVRASLPDGAGNALYDKQGRSSSMAESGMTLDFKAFYPWDEYTDYGKSLLNSIAYETGNDSIAEGYADTGGTITEHGLMADLDGDGNPEGTPMRFLYSQANSTINADVSASAGLTKTVRGPESTTWTNGQDGSVVVGKGESYTYRLRMVADSGSSLTGLVFYDSLENYHPANGGDQWRGTLESIDTSQLERKGIAPVVYYSTVPELSIADHEDLTDTSVWSTTAPDDLSQVTAIAIDCSKAKDGSDYTLAERNSLVALVHMKAPDDETYGPSAEAGAHAYNNVYLKSVLHNSLDGTISDQIIHNEFTQVGLKKATIADIPSLGSSGGLALGAFGLAAVSAGAAVLVLTRRGHSGSQDR